MELVRIIADYTLQAVTAAAVVGTFVLQWRHRKPPPPSFEIHNAPHKTAEGFTDTLVIVRNRADMPVKLTGIAVPRLSRARLILDQDCQERDGSGGLTANPATHLQKTQRQSRLRKLVPPHGTTRTNMSTGMQDQAAKHSFRVFIHKPAKKQSVILQWVWPHDGTRGRLRMRLD